jgi:hypothetical protein
MRTGLLGPASQEAFLFLPAETEDRAIDFEERNLSVILGQ